MAVVTRTTSAFMIESGHYRTPRSSRLRDKYDAPAATTVP
jgi:hypothetical protein